MRPEFITVDCLVFSVRKLKGKLLLPPFSPQPKSSVATNNRFIIVKSVYLVNRSIKYQKLVKNADKCFQITQEDLLKFPV